MRARARAIRSLYRVVLVPLDAAGGDIEGAAAATTSSSRRSRGASAAGCGIEVASELVSTCREEKDDVVSGAESGGWC